MHSKKSQMAELRRSLTDGIELKFSGRRMTLKSEEAPDAAALLALGSDDEGETGKGAGAAAFWKKKESGDPGTHPSIPPLIRNTDDAHTNLS